MDDPVITRRRECLVYENRFASVYDDDVAHPDGREGRYLRIVEAGGRPGAAALAVCGNRVALVRVYRYPTGEWEWAIPRGFAHGDDPLATARAELVEELGAEPVDLVELGRVYPNSGLLAGWVQLVLARYDTEVVSPLDTAEIAAVRWVDLATLQAEITDGRVEGGVRRRIEDGFTLAALGAATVRGLIHL